MFNYFGEVYFGLFLLGCGLLIGGYFHNWAEGAVPLVAGVFWLILCVWLGRDDD